MTEDNQTWAIEISAQSVEEAIEKGLHQVGRGRDEVEIEVLEEGGRGLFGLGAKDAVIRLRVPVQRPSPKSESEPAAKSVAVEPEHMEPIVAEEQAQPAAAVATADEEMPPAEDAADAGGEDDYLLEIAREIVMDLLERMHVKADAQAAFIETENQVRRPAIRVDVTGNDLSYLIGRRAETLNALQYIARLILGKELGRAVTLQVDVQGYRSRRREQLERLARKMADQAVASGRRQYLEPMPPEERRIIHIELRKNPLVETESFGEGNRRKVTIRPVDD